MFNFVPRFGIRLSSSEDWCHVPLSLLPSGYKLERRMIRGRPQYRLRYPDGATRTVRGPEHARLLVEISLGDGVVARYERALFGVVRDENGDLLVFAFGDEYDQARFGTMEEIGDLVQEIADELDDNIDLIDAISENARGLVYDLNSINPWSFFDEIGDVYDDRWEQIEEVAQLVTELAT